MRRGEVRWYKFPKPDKNRPVLILTRTSILEYLGEVTVPLLTRTVRNIPSEVLLSTNDGVPEESARQLRYHLQTVSRGKIGSLIAALSSSKRAKLPSPSPSHSIYCRRARIVRSRDRRDGIVVIGPLVAGTRGCGNRRSPPSIALRTGSLIFEKTGAAGHSLTAAPRRSCFI